MPLLLAFHEAYGWPERPVGFALIEEILSSLEYISAALILPTCQDKLGFMKFLLVGGGGQFMNKKELRELLKSTEDALSERRRLGEFDANSGHMILLLRNLCDLIDHTISQMPPEKK